MEMNIIRKTIAGEECQMTHQSVRSSTSHVRCVVGIDTRIHMHGPDLHEITDTMNAKTSTLQMHVRIGL